MTYSFRRDGRFEDQIKRSCMYVYVYACMYVRARVCSGVSEIISDNSYAIGVRRHDCLTAAIQSAGPTYIYGADTGIEHGGFH